MDQRNPYGMPPGPGGRSTPMQSNGMQRGMMPPQQHYMSEMLFDPMAMNAMNGMNGMYHPAQHGGHRGMPPNMSMMHQGMVPPEEDPRFVDDIMSALGPGDLGDPVGMDPQQHMRQMQQPVYDQQQHLMPPRSQPQHHLRAPVSMPMSSQAPPQQGMQASVLAPPRMAARQMPQQSMSQQMQMPQQPSMQVPNPMQAQMQNQRMPSQSSMPVSSGMGPSSTMTAPAAGARRQATPPPVVPPTVAAPAPIASSNALVPAASSFNASKSTASSSSRALTTSSGNDGAGSGSDDEFGGDEDSNKKKERRRQQVRYASRRRRKKQKDEESFLRDRIEELKEQIRIIGGDLTEQCSQMAGMSEQALTEAYEKQMITVQNLRKDNNKLKEQLLQHENFARMIQYGLNALPSDCRDQDRKKLPGVPMWFSDQMNPLKGPTLVVDLNLCHEAVRQAYNELKSFGPTVNAKTNVCYAMGWKTELWATGTCLSFRAVRTISDKNIRAVANASWDIITSPEKCKRIYPDVKQFRILQKVTDDIVVVHRIASVASDLQDREFISVAFRFRDENNYFIGIKSITVQTECAENCIRGDECQGWMFTGSHDEDAQWKAHFLGYYDVKGDKDDKVLNQLANEAMFGMLRWESEAMHPLTV
ncbi:TPA: hypothetical protein N0F65_006755 [Lagenidium giganteum]|uniref:BZIP domain-containing protein n=1 Tax=Lagenidium giganteum TaxID=4803 RepID=A0AAV2YZY7_9STRA|nr:TPA: hypothetical protein N0F65_006755 [Lagenidium giganteum]